MEETKNSRRSFISSALLAGGAAIVTPGSLMAKENIMSDESGTDKSRPKVLFFDVNETLLDLKAMQLNVGAALGGRKELLPLWFTTMLQYSLVSTVGNQYHDFGAIGAAALTMVAHNNGIELTDVQAKEAIKPILSLPPHSDVKEGLTRFKKAGYTMVSFTNSSNKAVAVQLQNAGLANFFDVQLSIEDIGKFKPHFDAYNWAARKMNVLPAECMLVAAHGWDVAGAAWAGWRTAFVSRPGQQLFPLAPAPEFNVPNLHVLAEKLVGL